METIEIGEKTWVQVDADRMLIRRQLTAHKVTVIHYVFFTLVACGALYAAYYLFASGRSGGFICFIMGLALLSLVRQYQYVDIILDLKSKELRMHYILFKRKFKRTVLFTNTSTMSFGWMNGSITDERDDEPIEGYELVVYKNKYNHKDLLFFRHKTSVVKLTTLFKEKLNLEIHNRLKPNKGLTI